MNLRPTPLMSHENPAAAEFGRVREWNAHNKERSRFEFTSHSNRVTTGGWPKPTGTDEKKMREALCEIDAVLRHPHVQATIRPDENGVMCIRYRIPDKHEEGVPGVVNTGRGVMYGKEGLRHLMNPDGADREFIDLALKKKAAKRARKVAKNASQELSQ